MDLTIETAVKTRTADESAIFLANRITEKLPTAYFRFGDGLIECLYRPIGKTNTCDGELYTDALAAALRDMLAKVMRSPDVFLGEWSRDPETTLYLNHWREVSANFKGTYLDFEALLFQRLSPTMAEFYKAVKNDNRRKLFMGPPYNAGAAAMMRADFFEIPHDTKLFDHVDCIEFQLEKLGFDVLLYGAGMAGNIPVVNLWEKYPERTYINLGSAMDLLFRGRPTRSNQIRASQARLLMRELLP